jgi:hypothetical protein
MVRLRGDRVFRLLPLRRVVAADLPVWYLADVISLALVRF